MKNRVKNIVSSLDMKEVGKSLREFRNNLSILAYRDMFDMGAYSVFHLPEEVYSPFLKTKDADNFDVGMVASWGIVHHTDDDKYSCTILVSEDIESKWCFKYYDPIEKKEVEKHTGRVFTFDLSKLHSLAPKKSHRKPFVGIFIDIY